ncbi:glutamate receptor ionotropic, kainate 4 [Diachasma alloeum]|uniref:Ionotropic receptor 75u.3 n=1 Tax=Diachasma alloeum TaxID=454923 RepID=A0A4E0RMB5_9HYME|nr:glutamate receptor ionotropic, kainate 4 [Diachasma alloeum]THK32888.1 ionotropic receptor 75u.3 [Diachasma alloeum]
MLIVSVIAVLIFSVGVSGDQEMDKILQSFIVDVITSLYASSSFTVFHCAKPDDITEFSRFMSRHYQLHEVATISEAYKFRFIESPLSHQNFYVVDLGCAGVHELLIQANNTGSFVGPTKWLILQDLQTDSNATANENFHSGATDQAELRSVFEDFHVFPDSEVIVGQKISDNSIKILSVYRPSPVRSLIIEDRGTWNSIDGIQLRDHDVSSRRRTDLQQTPLKACSVVTHPDTMNHLEDLKDKQVDVITKVGYAFSKLLAARINATVTFTFAASWGYKEKNGSWSGMIGEIDRNEVDFGATATFIIASRIDAVDFIQLYTPNRIRFVFRRPPLSHVSNLFTLPFTESVWIGISVLSCIGFVVLYLSMAWEWRIVKDLSHDEKLTGDLEIKPAFGDNFLILIGAVTQQGSAYEPRSVPARIVIFMLLVFCLSLYAAYAANIVALLQSTSDSIKNVEDLMNSPLKLGIQDIVYNRHYFGSFEDPLRKEFYERRIKKQKDIWLSLTEGIGRMRNELFAFHTELTSGYDVVQSTYEEDEKCGFEEIDYLYVSDPAFAIKRRSPYREIFRVGGIWLQETGIKERYIRIMYNKKPPCNNQKKFVGVGTIECYAAYLTIGYGMLLTFGILLFEIIWSKR